MTNGFGQKWFACMCMCAYPYAGCKHILCWKHILILHACIPYTHIHACVDEWIQETSLLIMSSMKYILINKEKGCKDMLICASHHNFSVEKERNKKREYFSFFFLINKKKRKI